MQAGPFGAWLAATRRRLRGEGNGVEVPCGDCVGCCTSSYFIHVAPDETATLAVIPFQLLTRAPGRPRGHVLMGFDGSGACPMFNERGCSIYEHRPRTCRDYDCRLFAAAGLDAGGADKAVINTRVRSWSFTYESDADRRAHDAVRAAAAFVLEHAASFPGGSAPSLPSEIAVLAVKTYTVFLAEDAHRQSTSGTAAAIVAATREFDAG